MSLSLSIATRPRQAYPCVGWTCGSGPETAVRAIVPEAVVARTSLIIGGPGHGRSAHERRVHEPAGGVHFTDDVRCPVHVRDLAEALLELAAPGRAGIYHRAGADAVSRHELGLLIARRDGLAEEAVRAGRRADLRLRGPCDIRLTSTRTPDRLRGAREFLKAAS